MTPRMKAFLTSAAKAAPGKGIPLDAADAQIAGRAVSSGFAETWGTRFMTVAVITMKGRAALTKARGAAA